MGKTTVNMMNNFSRDFFNGSTFFVCFQISLIYKEYFSINPEGSY